MWGKRVPFNQPSVILNDKRSAAYFCSGCIIPLLRQWGMQALAVPLLLTHSPACLPVFSTIAALFCALRSEPNRGRQVTNLNGASILRIVQQSHGAAVFPLEIPDAATHESAQHLLRESLLLRASDQNNKLNTSVQVNVTLTTIPGPLHEQRPRIQAPKLAPSSSR